MELINRYSELLPDYNLHTLACSVCEKQDLHEHDFHHDFQIQLRKLHIYILLLHPDIWRISSR